MQKLPCLVVAASAAALVLLPAGVALAQGAPSDGTAPAATSTAAPETKRAPIKVTSADRVISLLLLEESQGEPSKVPQWG